ncbi:MAG TPA: M17 family peptidase N-terminal domain-containing protein, partial [Hyphomonadaceae bacterium]|nr:M17 family peptidase N-terminal domain-containing protein [Hyphomonadaceae bacterium]
MQIKFSAEPTGDAVAFVAYEGDKGMEFGDGLDPAAEAAFRRAASAGTFKGGAGQVIEILAPEWNDAARALLFGVGRKSTVSDVSWQKAAAGLVKRLLTSGAKSLAIVGAPDRSVAAQLAFGARLAAYRFDTYRPSLKAEKKPTLTTISIVTDSAAGARSDYGPLSAKAEGIELARNLV